MSEILATNLRLRLALMNTTWKDLAEESDLSPANVRAWVNRCSPRSSTLEKLADLLQVPSHALLDPDFNPKDYPID